MRLLKWFLSLFNFNTKKVSDSSVDGLKISDDLMDHVAPQVMVKGQKFWLNDVLYKVTNARGDGKISLRVIAGKKGKNVVRGK
jgi:hypothetical protein